MGNMTEAVRLYRSVSLTDMPQLLCYTTTTTTTHCVVCAKLANSYSVFVVCCLLLIGSLAALNYLLMPPVATQQALQMY